MKIAGKVKYHNGKYIDFQYRNDFVTPESYKISLHTHDFCEMCIFIKGEMRHIVENNTYSLKNGDIFICRANELHHGISVAPSQYERFVFFFSSDIFNYLENGNQQLLAFLDSNAFGKENLIQPDINSKTELFALLNRVKKILEAQQDNCEIMAYSYIIQIFNLISELYKNFGYTQRQRCLPEYVENALQYINQNFNTIKGISEISDYLHINKDYLSRLFLKHIGISITYYIQSKKIAKSKELLQNNSSVTEACLASGFNSVSYYISVFHKMVGKTPMEYKHDLATSH